MSTHRELARKHLVPHFTPKAAWHSDSLPVIERGEGCYLYAVSYTHLTLPTILLV